MTTAATRRLSSLRVAARLARRETRRRPWRTLLVALLVAVPVTGMVIAAVWVRTEHQSPAEQWRGQWGLADVYATPSGGGAMPSEGGAADFIALLPEGSRTVTYRSEHGRVLRTVDGRRSPAEVLDLPTDDPMVAPIVQVTSGRLPERAGEVFLARSVADRLDARPGDTLRFARPEATEWHVVGIGERRAWWGSDLVVLGPGTSFPWRTHWGDTAETILADLPDGVTAAQLGAVAAYPNGVSFAPGLAPPTMPGSASWDTGDPSDASVAWSWVIGAVVLTVVGIVIAAAFAAGARRQLATLGQLAANGAPPSVLRRVLFLQGTWTGLLGSILGLGLAAAVLAAVAPHLDRLFQRDVESLVLRPFDLVPIVGLGITAATVAALVPARTTARVPVLAALAGRRPLRPVPTWLTVVGVTVGAAGLALLGLAVLGSNEATTGGAVWALTAIVGGVAVLLGACAVAPGYVSVLEPLAVRLRGASRLAARSLARQRTRTGAVVSAVCATSALALGAAALVGSADAKDDQNRQWMRDDEAHLQASLQGWVPGRAEFEPFQTPIPVPDALLTAVLTAVPGADVHHVPVVRVPAADGYAHWEVRSLATPEPTPAGGTPIYLSGGPYPQIAMVAGTELDALYDFPAAVSEALARDGIVALNEAEQSGRATVALVGESGGQSGVRREMVSPFEVEIVAASDVALGSLPRVLVTAERAAALGLEPAAGVTVVRAPAPLTEEQRTAIQDAVQDHGDLAMDTQPADGALTSVGVSMLYPTAGLDPQLLEGLLAAAALIVSLFVVSVSLALATAETRDERDVLVVVGARPQTMRSASGHKAFMLTALGAVLAVPVGFLPVSVFVATSANDLPLVFPWRVAALLLVAVPLLAAVATTMSSGMALRLRPVRVSTMAFD